MPPGSPGKYFIARLRGGDVAAVGSQPEGAPPTAMWNTYVWVDSADETASKVRDAGGSVADGAVRRHGRRPDGGVRRSRGRRVLRLAGEGAQGRAGSSTSTASLNFNDLNTRDPEGAKAFYGSVFGWETLGLGGGFEMWTLPGYGDYLERDNPGLRERMAEVGAPGGLRGRGRERSTRSPTTSRTTPPHWGVTFAVDDADAIAEKAAELGGQVVVPPFDAPWVRMTVITDPQGATFTASKFVPENRSLAEEADAAISGS